MSPVSLQRHGAVSVISIDNPPVNALSQAVREGLVTCIDTAEADEECQAIVIRCDGRTFIAGADIKEFGKPPLEPYLPDVVNRIEACEKPVIAAIHGTALGGGFETAMGCHYRIADPTGAVGLPEVNLGLLPGACGTQRLPRLTGAAKALDIMLSGRPVKASAALEAGAIDEVTDGSDLREAAIAFAEAKMAGGPRRISEMSMPDTDPAVFEEARKRIAPKTRGLISPGKIIDAVELATKVSFGDGCAKEREFFVECMASPQSGGLRHAFFAERSVSKVPGIDKSTPPRELNKVAVIGAGTMGAGIAYNALTSGMEVVLLDNSAEGLERGEKTIRGLYEGGLSRGKISESAMEEGLSRFSASQEYDAIADVDIVIEAVFENMEIKKEVFSALDKTVRQGAVLASNTSTLSVDEIASATNRPEDVIGLHFFSPAHIMRLLEIVRGGKTSPEVIATSLALAKKLRKIGVVVGNCFGFVGNRMLYSYGRESQLMLLEGAAPEYIDKTLYDFGMAMGPNAVGDLAGLDVGYKTRVEREDKPDDPRFYRIADVLVEMGRYGQKTGKGTYLYEEGSRKPVPDPEVAQIIKAESDRLGIEHRDISEQEIIERCVYGLVVEGARILEEGIASRSSDIDVVWMNGYGFPRHRGGPMHYADTIGLDKVYATVCDFEKRFGSEYWEPPALLKKLAESGGKFSDRG
jgi:3-hydroxyacyl-CoA dehydrogenase